MTEKKRVEAPQYDPLPIDVPAIIRLFVLGVGVGLLGWVLYTLISQYFIIPVFCRSADAFTVCNNGGMIAWVSAHIIVMILAVAGMARMAVYRPLLVALAALAALWGAQAWLGELSWWQGLGWQALLFGLAFALFGWLARAANFVVVLVITIVLVILARIVLALA